MSSQKYVLKTSIAALNKYKKDILFVFGTIWYICVKGPKMAGFIGKTK
jgi:hypothetical protein